jgi:AcrR family transcriptional regulator
MPKVSPNHKEQRKQAILDAAQSVFLGKGYQLATVDDIAARRHLSVGAVYQYFATKSDIMLTLLERKLGRTPQILERLTRDIAGAWPRLVRCIEIFVHALHVRHPSTGRFLIVAWGEAIQDNTVRQGLHERYSGLVGYLASIIEQGIMSGEFSPAADAPVIAAMLVGMADGVTLYWSTGTPGMDLRAMRLTTLQMLRTYLKPSD